MLNSMRNFSKGIVTKLLMGLLVVSFAVWGIGDIFTNTGPSYAAKIGSQTVSINAFQQQRSLVARQLESLNIKDLPAGQLELSVIRQLVQQNLTLQSMQEMGLHVNDDLLKAFILNAPEFKGITGTFSADAFKNVIESQKTTEAAFVSQIKLDIAGRFFFDSLTMNDASTPASIRALDALVQGETRDAVLLTIPASGTSKVADEAALQAFYDENKTALYLLPETRTLEYVVLTEGDLKQLVAKSTSATPLSEESARRDARDRVMLELGNTIEDELAGGKTMAEAFSKAGVTATPRTLENANAELAKTSADDIIKTVVEQGFGLSEGEISRLIRSKQGALLMVSAKKINPAAPKPFDAVKADVASRLAKEQTLDVARAKAQTVKAALAKAPNWQAVAEENNLSNRQVSRLKRPVEGKKPESNGVPLALHQAIFERNVNEVAGPLTLENGDQVVALITASHVPAVSPTAAVEADPKASEKLSQEIENRAFQSFTTKHKVTINPGLLRPAASAQ